MFLDGRVIATGRFRDSGWSGMGPVLIAYRPWDTNENAPNAGASIQATPLLRYADSTETAVIERCLSGYQHPDEWSGGAWLTTTSGKSAVLFGGAKSVGAKYWYGIDERMFFKPSDVELEMLGSGSQRRYRLGDVAYDRANGLLYALELFADGAKPVVHVWRVE